jgi:hypothetical protein
MSAESGHRTIARQCPLLEEERTSRLTISGGNTELTPLTNKRKHLNFLRWALVIPDCERQELGGMDGGKRE